MSVVVADTGPLNYLIQCEAVGVLPKLYGQVIIARSVLEDLTHPAALEPVRQWSTALPNWVTVQSATTVDPGLALGSGETEAICLAQEICADKILLDDRRARRAALARGLAVKGTLGVLETAAEHHFLTFADVLLKLGRTNFRIDPELLVAALKRDAARNETGTG